MSYNTLEVLRRNSNIRLRHGADSPTPTVAAAGSAETPIWYDDRTSYMDGSSVVSYAVWVPQDTITGVAAGPTVNINRKTAAGLENGPAAAPTATAAAAPAGVTGAVTAGTHVYAVTYLVGGQITQGNLAAGQPGGATGAGLETQITPGQLGTRETVAGPSTGATTVAAGQVVNLTAIPTGGANVIARRIYRSDAGTATPLYFIGEIYDNTTTTFTDNFVDVELAPTAPTAALAGAGAGNLNIGAYFYGVTFVNAQGESPVSANSNTVTTTTVNGQVNLTAIATGPAGTVARKLYRTVAGGSALYLLATLADNTTTTYADNVKDTQLILTATAPTAASQAQPPTAASTSVTLATFSFAVGVNAVAFEPVFLPITGNSTQVTLAPGDILSWQLVGGTATPALTGGRVWVNIDRL